MENSHQRQFYTRYFKEFLIKPKKNILPISPNKKLSLVPVLKKEISIQQYFSLPPGIIYYLKKNASSKVFQKLFKSCKYFMLNQSFIYVNEINSNYRSWGYTEGIPSSATKIWMKGENIYLDNSGDLESIYPKLFYVNVKLLSLTKQTISFDEYLFLISAGNVNWVDFRSCNFKYSDGRWVQVADIIEKVPLIEKFGCFPPSNYELNVLTIESSEKLAKLPIFPNLNEFRINQNNLELKNFLLTPGYEIFKNKHSNVFFPKWSVQFP